MKKTIAITLTVAAAIAIALITASSASTNANSSQLFTRVINPDIPEKVEFCGKEIDLDRSDWYERYDRELTSMIYTHGNTLLTIKRANKYFPVMSPILKKNGVPQDILYLACVESNLNPRAYSGAKAAGIWQFIASTAQENGLEVSDEVDERYNLEKATEAACRFLKKAYQKYGNWESVMASYNCGQARISKELEAQGQDTFFELYLNDETSRYVFRILAMKEIMENPGAYGFLLKDDQLYQPEKYTTVEVSTPVADWPQWAKEHGITYAQLREANPWIRAKKLTNKAGKTYKVKIPTKDSLSRHRQEKNTYNKKWTRQ